MTFEILQKKLADKSWTDTQDADFIAALGRIENTFQQMGAQIYIFISYFEQYVAAIQASPIFSSDDIPSNDSQSSNPTQTPADVPKNPQHPSNMEQFPNRAERRKEKPSRSPLDIVNEKKLNNPHDLR
jgi:hypothetical protein